MSDWKSRAVKVDEPVDWKSRAVPAGEVSEDPETLGSYAKSFGLGAAQGASMGFADEAEAGVRSLIEDKSYDQLLKDVRERYKKAEEEHDITSFLGNITGGVGSMLAGGAALKGAGLVGKTAAGAIGAGEAAGLAEGATAAIPSLETGAMAIAKPTFGQAVKVGAGTGALSGAGTSEASLKDDPSQLLKDTVSGAEVGGALAGGGHALGKLIGWAGGVAKDIFMKSKTGQHMIEDFSSGVEHGKTGQDIVGKLQEQHQNLRGVAGDFLNKVQTINDSIQDKYNKFYQAADQAVAVDANELDVPIAKLAAKINKERTLGYRKEAVDHVLGIVDQLKETAENGKVKPSMIKQAMSDLQQGHDRIVDSNRYGAETYLEAKKGLNSLLQDKMGPEMSEALANIDKQYKDLSVLRSRFDIDKNLPAQLGTEEGQKAAFKLKDQLTSLFKQTAVRPEAESQLTEGLDMMKQLAPKEASDASQKIEEASKTYNLARRLGEESPFVEGIGIMGHASGRSKTAMASYQAGRAVGAVSKGLSNTLETHTRVVKDIADAVMSDDPGHARQAATEMMQSPTESTRKFGKMLLQITNQEDMSKRRALMFSLSQQPAFREAVEGKPEK